MCGRFIDPDLRGTDVEFSELKIIPVPRRFNIKPTQDVLTVDGDGRGAMARWWLVPSWFKGELAEWKATTFNARIEEAASKPTFRGPWRYGRCLIPAGGYYEWSGPKGARQPHAILSAGNDATLWFAGLTSVWRDLRTCTIVTRAAVGVAAEVHSRMPAILTLDEREAWLAGSDDTGIGASVPLRQYPVRRFGIRDDGPELIEELDA